MWWQGSDGLEVTLDVFTQRVFEDACKVLSLAQGIAGIVLWHQ